MSEAFMYLLNMKLNFLWKAVWYSFLWESDECCLALRISLKRVTYKQTFRNCCDVSSHRVGIPFHSELKHSFVVSSSWTFWAFQAMVKKYLPWKLDEASQNLCDVRPQLTVLLFDSFETSFVKITEDIWIALWFRWKQVVFINSRQYSQTSWIFQLILMLNSPFIEQVVLFCSIWKWTFGALTKDRDEKYLQ